MADFDLMAELLPQITEAYKASVCGYQPITFGGHRPPVAPKLRWSQAFGIWAPILHAALADSADDLQTVCSRLTGLKFVESAQVVPASTFTDRNRLAPVPGAAYVHVVCVPFRDLEID